MSTTISIIQNHNSRFNLSNADIFLDNQFLCSLSENENKLIKIKPGTHCLTAKLKYFNSTEYSFELDNNESLDLILYSNYIVKKRVWRRIALAVFLLGFILSNITHNMPVLWTAIVFAILSLIWDIHTIGFKGLFYYSTIGRKQMLSFKENDY